MKSFSLGTLRNEPLPKQKMSSQAYRNLSKANTMAIPNFYPPSSASEEKQTADSPTSKTAQNFVTSIYNAKVADLNRTVTITWLKNLMSHTLNILVENPYGENHYNCKIDLKTWQFWGRKGLKSFKVDGKRVDVFWDFRTSRFATSPEPCSDFYVAIVSSDEVVLLLGDMKNEAFKRTKSRPSLVDPMLLHKKECVFGKKCFYSRTMFGYGKREHDITIETSLSGPSDPEMLISVDGIMLIRVMNLHWKFRGNESVVVENKPVLIFWDVHDWLYNSGPNSGQGIFIFRQGVTETEGKGNDNGNGSSGDWRILCDDEDSGNGNGFSHLLHAWKID